VFLHGKKYLKILMESIIYPSDNFNFENIALAQPTVIQGGSYFTKITNNFGPLYLQTPSCGTKQGIISSGKKAYCDLMYTNEDQDILAWIEKLIDCLQLLIFNKRKLWFHTEMEMEDIDSAFTPPIRIYKSGKFQLIRTYIHGSNINKPLHEFSCYDENENKVNPEILNGGRRIIPLLEIKGIKFSSKSFNLDIALKQVMVIEETNFLNNCLIKIDNQIQAKTEEKPSSKELIEEFVEKSVTTNVEEPVTTNVEESVTTNVEEPVTTNVEEPVTTNVEEPVTTNVEEPVTTNVEEPVTMNVEEPVGEKNIMSNNSESHSSSNDDESSNDSDTESMIDTTDAPPLLNLDLEEIHISTDDIEDITGNNTVKILSKKESYYDIWKIARDKAKQARKAMIEAYLHAKKIKVDNMLDNLDEDSEDEYMDEYIESLEDTEM